MSNNIQTQSNDTPRQILLKAVTPIRSAEQLLVESSRATSDPAKLTKISLEYNHLDSFLTQLLHTQAIADDAAFTAATAALKQQATALQTKEEDIKKIVDDVHTATQIVGYMAQVLAFVEKLP
jgi:hypothetical protein